MPEAGRRCKYLITIAVIRKVVRATLDGLVSCHSLTVANKGVDFSSNE